MLRYLLSACLCVPAALGATAEPADRLPQPDYESRPGDPPWLARAVQFHGHLGPWVVAGARFGMAGLRAVGAKGYFDIEVTCEGPFAQPPRACFLDGLQVATGATLGKRALHWVQAERITVRFRNTKTGRTATLRPAPALVGLLGSLKMERLDAAKPATGQKAAHGELESVARRIASMPEQDVVTTETGT